MVAGRWDVIQRQAAVFGGKLEQRAMEDNPLDSLGGRVNAIKWTLTCVSFVFVTLRIYCKISRRTRLWWDDYILISAWLLLLPASACDSWAIRLGYGMHVWQLPPERLETIGLWTLIAPIFSLLSIMLAKTSFAVTILRITDGWARHLIWFLIVTMNIMITSTILIIWLKCTPVEKSWKPYVPGKCLDFDMVNNYMMFTSCYSGVMDIILAMLPWKIIWGTRIPKREKFSICLAMTMGVVTGAFAFVKAFKVPYLSRPDWTYYSCIVAIWGHAEGAGTIMAASLPALRVLFLHRPNANRRGSRTTTPSQDVLTGVLSVLTGWSQTGNLNRNDNTVVKVVSGDHVLQDTSLSSMTERSDASVYCQKEPGEEVPPRGGDWASSATAENTRVEEGSSTGPRI